MKYGKGFRNNMDYRRRGGGHGQGFGLCEFHVHPPGTACLSESIGGTYLAERQMPPTLFLGPYPVQSKVKLKPGINDSTVATFSKSGFQRRALRSEERRVGKE